ncbi:hypothetical protein DIPPA_63080 [Diplonema papillatum]|nr:hypothetical protein DIPPA_63080 [Diplonema papillatum]
MSADEVMVGSMLPKRKKKMAAATAGKRIRKRLLLKRIPGVKRALLSQSHETNGHSGKGDKDTDSLGPALLRSVIEQVRNRGGVFVEKAVVGKADRDSLAELLLGLDVRRLTEVAHEARRSCTLTLLDAASSVPVVERLSALQSGRVFQATKEGTLAIPFPNHVEDAFFPVFDALSLGMSCFDPCSGSCTAGGDILFVKPTPSSCGFVSTSYSSSGEDELCCDNFLILQLSGSAEWRRSTASCGLHLDEGDAAFLKSEDASPFLAVTAPEGCAALVLRWASVPMGSFLRGMVVLSAPHQALTVGTRDLSATARQHLQPMAFFDDGFTSRLILACKAFNPSRHPTVGSTSTRAPLLPRTLHASMRFAEFLSVSAEALTPKHYQHFDALKIDPADITAATKHFISAGTMWAPPLDDDQRFTSLIDRAREFILKGAAPTESTNELTAGALVAGKKYFPVHFRQDRQDIGQELNGGFAENILRAVCSRFQGVLYELLGNARLVEFSCLVSYPGAQEQPPHSDSTARSFASTSAAHLISVFVPLVDVAHGMGPLEVWPQTHSTVQLLPQCIKHLKSLNGRQHQEFMSEMEAASDVAPGPLVDALCYDSVKMTVPKGSAVLMDSRCFHRGSRNSCCVRPVLYFTFASESGSLPEGSTYSLVPSLRRRKLRLNELVSSVPERTLPAFLPVKRVDLPELRGQLAKYTHHGCLASVIARVPPEEARGRAQEMTNTYDEAYDALVSGQEICIERLLSCDSDTMRNSLAKAVRWLKREAHRIRLAAEQKHAMPQRHAGVIHRGGAITFCSDEEALIAETNGASICVTVPKVAELAQSTIPELAACCNVTAVVLCLRTGSPRSPRLCNTGATILVPLSDDVHNHSLEFSVFRSTRNASTLVSCRDSLDNTSILSSAVPTCTEADKVFFCGRLSHAVVVPSDCSYEVAHANDASEDGSGSGLFAILSGSSAPEGIPSFEQLTIPFCSEALRTWAAYGFNDFATSTVARCSIAMPPNLVTDIDDRKTKFTPDHSTLARVNPFVQLRAVDSDDLCALPEIVHLDAASCELLGNGILQAFTFVATFTTHAFRERHFILATRSQASRSTLSALGDYIRFSNASAISRACLPLPHTCQEQLVQNPSLWSALRVLGILDA